MASADLLLHPVRLRVVQAFLGDRALTTSGLRSELPDVPPTSLYRHVARLVEAGVLAVIAERRVRGAVERTYVLRPTAASINLDELATMSRADHRSAFLAFLAGLIADFDRYLARDDISPGRDGSGFRLAGMWLTDSEAAELGHDLLAVLQPRLANAPKGGRKRWILATVVLPGTEPNPNPQQSTPARRAK
jgi:Helix-turn-helix domain